jgi:putative Mn2+ efflux pump MntP
MGGISEGNFNQPLTRTDALYFTVTVFATVGFGDIVATTQGARLVVMGQMVAGIVIIGLGARIIVDAVKRGQQRQPVPDSDAPPEADSPTE